VLAKTIQIQPSHRNNSAVGAPPTPKPLLFSCDFPQSLIQGEFKNPDIDGNVIAFVSSNLSELHIYDLGPDRKINTRDDRGQIFLTSIFPGQVIPAPSISGNTIVYSEGINQSLSYLVKRYEAGQDSLFGTQDDFIIAVANQPSQFVTDTPVMRGSSITWTGIPTSAGKSAYSCSIALDGSQGGCLFTDSKNLIFSGRANAMGNVYTDETSSGRFSVWNQWLLLYGETRALINGMEIILSGSLQGSSMVSDSAKEGFIVSTERNRTGANRLVIGNVFSPSLKIPVSTVNTVGLIGSNPRVSKSFPFDSKNFVVWQFNDKIFMSEYNGLVLSNIVSPNDSNNYTQPIVQDDLVIFTKNNNQILTTTCGYR